MGQFFDDYLIGLLLEYCSRADCSPACFIDLSYFIDRSDDFPPLGKSGPFMWVIRSRSVAFGLSSK